MVSYAFNFVNCCSYVTINLKVQDVAKAWCDANKEAGDLVVEQLNAKKRKLVIDYQSNEESGQTWKNYNRSNIDWYTLKKCYLVQHRNDQINLTGILIK